MLIASPSFVTNTKQTGSQNCGASSGGKSVKDRTSWGIIENRLKVRVEKRIKVTFHCRRKPSRANSKISYKVGNWHVSPPQLRAFIPRSGDDSGMTSLPPSRYSRAF